MGAETITLPNRPSTTPVDTPVRTTHGTLFERARAGDNAAWRQLIVDFHPLVLRAVRRVCRSSDVDDVVQDVWLVMINRGHTVQSPECLPGWLRTVAYHAALEHVRRNRAVPRDDLPDEPVSIDDDLDRDLPSTCRGVQSALQRLGSEERRLIVLLMASDRPNYAGISQATGRPMGSIGPTRQRLLERLSLDPDIRQLIAS